MVNCKNHIGIVLCIFLCVSCTRKNAFLNNPEVLSPQLTANVQGLPVTFLSIDDRDCYGIDVYDSLLVFTTNAPKRFLWADPVAEKVIGDYLYKGRGQNEMLSALYSDKFQGSALLYDLGQSKACLFDPYEAFSSGNASLVHECVLPEMTTDVMPVGNDRIASISMAKEQLSVNIQEFSTGNIVSSQPLVHIPGIYNYLTHLSSSNVYISDSDVLVMAMCYLPQVLFVTGAEVRCISPSAKGEKWDVVCKKEIPDLNVYYHKVCLAEGFCIGLFIDQPMQDWHKKTIPVHLHVFDLAGNFVADLTTDEYLKDIAYNACDRTLYALGYNNELYSYDIDVILQGR